MKKILLFTLLLFCSLNLMAQSGLQTGATAPDFSVNDASGKTLDLKSLLKSHSAVVLFFYRGQWCPYCNKYIKKLQDSLALLTSKGAYVIGVSPETDENVAKTISKTQASFTMVHDAGYKVMKAYNVNYIVDDPLLAKYKGFGIDLEKNNGNTDHILPVPATYVIGKNRKILFVHFDKDYRKRANISAMLAVL